MVTQLQHNFTLLHFLRGFDTLIALFYTLSLLKVSAQKFP